MKELIKKIIKEEVDDKKFERLKQVKETLINIVNNEGLIEASKFVGGYDNVRNILRGTDYLNGDSMIKTIKDYFNQPNRLQYLDLNNDLGLEHIELEKGNTHLITLSALFNRGFVVQIYEKDDDGDFDLIDDSVISYEDDNNREEPLLKTIHLYELVDGIMERWENKNQ
jgi:hypothetical protein